MKKLILASLLAAFSASTLAADYYVVVPLLKQTTENISVTLNTTSLPGGLVGRPYAGFDFATALVVKGDPKFNGTGVKWSVVGGALPAGLTLGADGKLTGTPASAGTSNFQLQALYKTKTGQQVYQVVVSDFTVVLASSAPPAALQGTAYAYDFKPRLSVSGDPQFTQAQVTWSGSGTLPRGLELTRDGVLSGVPTEPGTSSFNIVASYQGRSATQAYQLVVNALAPDFQMVGNITTSQSFGTVSAGSTSSPMTFPLVNAGTGAGSLTLPAFTGANPEDFSATTTCTNVVPNANCQVGVTFRPTQSGSRYASLAIAGKTYNFVGTVAAPKLQLSGTPATTQNFAATTIGVAATSISVGVVNSGTAAGSLTLPALAGANPGDFSASSTCANVAPQGTCQVIVGFKPTQAGARSMTLDIAGTVFTFNGTGQQPATNYVVLTSGTSYQIPAGVTTVKAWAVGGGGGGAGASASDGVSGGGGGAGGAADATFATTPGQTLTYTIGAGGPGGYGAAAGVGGGLTSVNYGSIALKAYGGTGGYFNSTQAAAGGAPIGGDGGWYGGAGAGASGDQGGGSGGGIGGVAGSQGGQAGANGASGNNLSGLHEALIGAGQVVGTPGVGANSSSSSPNNMSGTAGTGYGHGGGSAGWYGGNGGNGAKGGGGGGAAGYTGTQRGGAGGDGFIVLKLN
jgi:hypothetical protein